MIKFRLYFDKDEETKWLNQMSEEGWGITGFFVGFYNFEKCDKGKWNYQIDFGDRLFAVSDDYRAFMEETGAEIVQTWGYWIILRKPASEGKFELYTDVDSSIEHYTKIRRMFKIATIIELICFFVEIFAAIEGAGTGYVFAFIFIAILATLANAIMRINDILDKLNERKTGIETSGKRRKISVLMPIGMLLIGCSYLTKEYVPHSVTLAIDIVALAFELIGLYSMCKKR